MSLIEKLFHFDTSASSAWKEKLVRSAQFITQVAGEFHRDNCTIQASGLAYTSLLALVPMMAITFSLFTGFSAFSSMKDGIQEKLFDFFIPAKSGVVLEYINQFTSNTRTLGFVGMIALLVTSVMLFQNIETSLNEVWKIRSRRNFLHKFLIFTSVLVWGTLFIGASFYVTGKVRSLMAFESLMKITLFSRVALWIFPLALSVSAFILVMEIVPATKVRWTSAIIGGTCGGVLWEFAKGAFAHYAAQSVSYSVIYGSLALIPIFLVWLYLTWIIVMLATEVTYVHQNFASLVRRRIRGELIGRERLLLALRVYFFIAARFIRGGKPVRQEEIVRHFLVPIHQGQEIIDELCDIGHVLEVEDPPGGFIPSKSLEDLAASDLLKAMQKAPIKEAAVSELLQTDALAEQVLDRFETAGYSALQEDSVGKLLRRL